MQHISEPYHDCLQPLSQSQKQPLTQREEEQGLRQQLPVFPDESLTPEKDAARILPTAKEKMLVS